MKKKQVALLSTVVVAALVGGIVAMKRAGSDRPSGSGVTRPSARPGAPRPSRGSRTGTTIVDSRNAATPERSARALRDTLQTRPDRLSTTAALAPFDQAAFDADPQAYLAQVEPARCLQTAAPGEDVPALERQSQARTVVQTGGSAPLWVKGVPGAPVTFTAFDGGVFKENGFGSVTVQANANGLAVAHFTAGPGIGGDVNIIAGSPVSSGTQRFFIRVGGAQTWAAAETTSARAR